MVGQNIEVLGLPSPNWLGTNRFTLRAYYLDFPTITTETTFSLTVADPCILNEILFEISPLINVIVSNPFVHNPFVHSTNPAVQSVLGCGVLSYSILEPYTFVSIEMAPPVVNAPPKVNLVFNVSIDDVATYPLTVLVTSDRGI